MGPDLML